MFLWGEITSSPFHDLNRSHFRSRRTQPTWDKTRETLTPTPGGMVPARAPPTPHGVTSVDAAPALLFTETAHTL